MQYNLFLIKNKQTKHFFCRKENNKIMNINNKNNCFPKDLNKTKQTQTET